MMKNQKVRAAFVFLLCFLLQGGTLGILSNCRGIFNGPVCAELGFPLGRFTSYSVFYGIAVCAGIPLAARWVYRKNLRLTLTAAAVAVAGAEYAMSGFTAVWQWYLAAAVQGVCYAFLVVLTVPMLIGNWFAGSKGTFLGLSSISAGLIGAVMNSAGGGIIARYGWRAGYRFLGGALFVLLVPACLLFSWRSPEGEAANTPPPTRSQRLWRQPGFYLISLFAWILCCTVGYNQMLADIAAGFGYDGTQAAGYVSVALVGTILFKVLIGRLIDRRGIRTACWCAVTAIGAGFVLLRLGANAAALWAGSLLMGMPMAVSVVLVQAMARGIYGERAFSGVYPAISVSINLATNFGFSIIGWIVSVGGSATAAIDAGLMATAAAAALAALLFSGQKKEETSCE